MTFPVSPGVYPVVTDLSVIVPAAATSVAGIVIEAPMGLANQIVPITSNKQFTDMFGTPTPDRPSMYSALAYLQQGALIQVVRVVHSDAVAASAEFLDSSSDPTLIVSANSPGVWGNAYDIQISNVNSDAGTYVLSVLDEATGAVLTSYTVSKSPTQLDGFGNSQYVENVINGIDPYITVTDVAGAGYPLATTHALTGGGDGSAITAGDVINGWQFFAVKENVAVSVLIQGGWDFVAVQVAMITIAESRQDCMAILDIPYETTQSETYQSDMISYVQSTLNANTSFAAIYSGWILVYDQYNDGNIYLPPSGYVAAVIAYTAQVAEPWYAPAGLNRGIINALGVTNVFSEGDRDALYTANINPIQSFIGQGIQVYGQKTLQSFASALDRVNVRYLMITIMNAMTQALQPFVFEFNDTFTQENISSILNNYMANIESLQGVTDYLVVCNATNNTPQVVDNNELIVTVYVKPTRVAEFIQLNGIITATGASFTASS